MLKFNSFDEISIKKFYELKDIIDTPMSDEDKNVYLVSFFTGITDQEVLELTNDVFSDYIYDINQIFLDQQKTKHYFPKKKITIGETTYDILQNVNKLTVEQYIDLQTFGELEKENIGKVLSVFLIPENHKYNKGYDIESEIRNIEEHLNINDANSMLAFFLTKFAASTKTLLTYFKLRMMIQILMVKMKTWIRNKVRI